MTTHLVQDSSHITQIDYESSQSTLHVTFKGGRKYTYPNVPQDLHSQFVASPSKGTFFHSEIKPTYPHQA